VWETKAINHLFFYCRVTENYRNVMNKMHSVLIHSPGCDLKLDVTKRNKHLLHFLGTKNGTTIFRQIAKFLHRSKRFFFDM